jgi:GT2 family glycosyltransferase
MNIVVGIPTPPNNKASASLVAIASGWCQDTNAKLVLKPSPSPEEGRDKIISEMKYMIPTPTHVLFIDSDVIPRKNTLSKMMQHDKDILSAMVPICQQGMFKWNAVKFGDSCMLDVNDDPGQNPFKAESVGFGCVLVKTDVFEKIEWPYWRSLYRPGLRSLGEDIYFSYEARKAGYDIWVDPNIKCDHVTRASYLSIIRNMKGNTK